MVFVISDIALLEINLGDLMDRNNMEEPTRRAISAVVFQMSGFLIKILVFFLLLQKWLL